jgi:hypothetical protein
MGGSVSSAGDINGDGLDDLIMSVVCAGANSDGKLSTGKSYVIYGKTDTNAVDLSKLVSDFKYAINFLGGEDSDTFPIISPAN